MANDMTAQKWISVKERLPEKDGRYLVMRFGYCSSKCYVRVDIHSFALDLSKVDKYDFEGKNRAGWYNYDSEVGYYEINGVTHWMPLPEPPKEDV